jgi:hypothetical protein
MTASGTPQMWEKSLSQIILYGHELNPLSLDQPQNIHDIRRCDKNPVDSIGQKYLAGFIDNQLNRLKNLTHVLFHHNNRLLLSTFFAHNVLWKRPKGLKLQQAQTFAPLSPVFYSVKR